jgi:hypothetical protein
MVMAAALGAAAGISCSRGDYAAKVREILPPRWAITFVGTNTAPYNLGVKPGQRGGTRLELVGPTIVKGPRGLNNENESFQIWLMPPDYTPVQPGQTAQFEDAWLLGSNEAVSVYCTSFTTGTPSWRTWEEDIAKHLRLAKSGQTTWKRVASSGPSVARAMGHAAEVPRPGITRSRLDPARLAGEYPLGRLGYPVGTYVQIEGFREEHGKVGAHTMAVDTVSGEKLSEPISIWIENLKGGGLPLGKRCVLRGYESARMIGLPEEVVKAENLAPHQAAWQMQRYFIVTSVVEPTGLEKE